MTHHHNILTKHVTSVVGKKSVHKKYKDRKVVQ